MTHAEITAALRAPERARDVYSKRVVEKPLPGSEAAAAASRPPVPRPIPGTEGRRHA